MMLSVLGAGDVFGEVGVLLREQERTATIAALGEAVVRAVSREQFEQLRRGNPDVAEFMLQLLAQRTDRLSRLLAEAHHLPVEVRLARRLVDVGRHFARGVLPVVVPLTQEDLAQLVGASRQTTNQLLRAMEADGVVALARGRVEIHDVRSLRARCD